MKAKIEKVTETAAKEAQWHSQIIIAKDTASEAACQQSEQTLRK